MKRLTFSLLACTVLAASGVFTSAMAQDASIRKNLGERIPQLPKIDEISKTPIKGLFEIRIGTDVYYSDAQGNYLIQGSLIDTKNQRNLTEERINKLTAIQFNVLPFKDAFTIVRGDGKRQMAVFEDPNCSYCKRFERDLQKIDNVTVHLFLYPILGADSVEKSKAIWCAKNQGKTWQDWMVRNVTPPAASCDSTALTRNVELGRKFKINGTPTLVFADGSRVPGAVGADEVEKRLAQSTN